MTEYRKVSEITGEKLYKKGACYIELDNFCREFGFYEEVEDQMSFNDFIKYAEGQNEWIGFLLEEGFIEKISSGSSDEKFYLRVDDENSPIGERQIFIYVIDKYGHKIEAPYICSISIDGTLLLHSCVNAKVPITTTDRGYGTIVVSN